MRVSKGEAGAPGGGADPAGRPPAGRPGTRARRRLAAALRAAQGAAPAGALAAAGAALAAAVAAAAAPGLLRRAVAGPGAGRRRGASRSGFGPLASLELRTIEGEAVECKECEEAGSGVLGAAVGGGVGCLFVAVALNAGFEVVKAELEGRPLATADQVDRGMEPSTAVDLAHGPNAFVVTVEYVEKIDGSPFAVTDDYLLVVQRGPEGAPPEGDVGAPAAPPKAHPSGLAPAPLGATPPDAIELRDLEETVDSALRRHAELLAAMNAEARSFPVGGDSPRTLFRTPFHVRGAPSAGPSRSPSTGSPSTAFGESRSKRRSASLRRELQGWREAGDQRIATALNRVARLEEQLAQHGGAEMSVRELREHLEGQLEAARGEFGRALEASEAGLAGKVAGLAATVTQQTGEIRALLEEEKGWLQESNRTFERQLTERIDGITGTVERSIETTEAFAEQNEQLHQELEDLSDQIYARVDTLEKLCTSILDRHERLEGHVQSRDRAEEQRRIDLRGDIEALEQALHVEKKERMFEDSVLVDAINDYTLAMEEGLGLQFRPATPE